MAGAADAAQRAPHLSPALDIVASLSTMPLQSPPETSGSLVSRRAAVALMVLIAFSLGCGKSEKAPETVAKTPADGGGDKRASSLPDEFPKDVPILKNATLKLAMSQGDRMLVHLYTTSSVSDAAKFYDAELKKQGWQIESISNAAEMSSVSARKGDTRCGVTIAREGKGTLIRLAVSPVRS